MLCVCRQLLHDCGVGVEGEEEEGEVAAVGQHRILIFCQFKGILDIIENDLFKSVERDTVCVCVCVCVCENMREYVYSVCKSLNCWLG